MPNWCSTAYAIEGDAKEVKKLYGLMMGLQKRKEPSVKNGFGTTWVGCLVDALGGDYNEICCRGDWNSLERVGNVLKLETETAWGPCNETFELVCQKFPTLSYIINRKNQVWQDIGRTMWKVNISPINISLIYVCLYQFRLCIIIYRY
jgi:hypothetical protein